MTTDEPALAAEPVGDEWVDEVVERLMDRADACGTALLGEGGLLAQVTKGVLERALRPGGRQVLHSQGGC
ncbi:hypothetical protein [Peterkaempfera sp. SMS 1(5)a]